MSRCAFGMRAIILLGAALTLAVGCPALAAPITINFETLPSLPTQPNNFPAAGPMQTYNVPGVFTISGAVVLGNPTFPASFPAHGVAAFDNRADLPERRGHHLGDRRALQRQSSGLVRISQTG